MDGVYGLFFDGGKGHARIGRIVSYSPAERTVLREVEAVYSRRPHHRPPRLVERRHSTLTLPPSASLPRTS